jgi:hypothetical protein
MDAHTHANTHTYIPKMESQPEVDAGYQLGDTLYGTLHVVSLREATLSFFRIWYLVSMGKHPQKTDNLFCPYPNSEKHRITELHSSLDGHKALANGK